MVYSLPSVPKFRTANFRLQRVQAANPSRSGGHQGVDMAEPLWVCDLTTAPLTHAQAGAYKWRKAQLRGILRTLYLFDPERPRPLAYLYSGSWGNPQVASINRTNSTITLTGFSAGAIISDGDYGHWQDGPARRLHICGAGVADGSGNLTLTVEPAPPAAATATLPVAFTMEKASAEMVVMQMDIPYQAPITSQLTMQGAQIIRRF